MSDVKIGIVKFMANTLASDQETVRVPPIGTQVSKSDYQIWHFKVFIADAGTSTPVMNLQVSDFTFNFLTTAHSNKLFEVSSGIPLNNHPPHLSSLGGMYILSVWQLTTITRNLDRGDGIITTTVEAYPADWLEIIINSSNNAAGNALFYLH